MVKTITGTQTYLIGNLNQLNNQHVRPFRYGVYSFTV